MESHSDSKATGYPPQNCCRDKCLPTKHEERGYRAEMKDRHPNRRGPVDPRRVVMSARFAAHDFPLAPSFGLLPFGAHATTILPPYGVTVCNSYVSVY